VKKNDFVHAIVICFVLWAPNVSFGQSTASGQSAATQPSSEGWRFQEIPYLWGSSIDGRVGIADQTAEVDASFRNVLDHLHFAFMNLFEASWNNKLVVLTDLVYSDVRGERATPGPLFSGVTPNQKMFFLTPVGGYRMWDSRQTSVDVVGGIRFWRLNSELQFQPGLLAGVDVQEARNWVDGILGLRGKVYLPKKWWVAGYGDAGGGGSNFTYQILGTAGVDVHTHYALVFGYRYLNVDYDKDHFLFDVAMKGPVFGFTFKF
jgi:hypothetical protein